MPLIVYKNAHGENDYPLHFAFFGALEERGLLDRFDFALDVMFDLPYCENLCRRFPQLTLTTQHSLPRRAMKVVRDRVGRFYRPVIFCEGRRKFDAVIEAAGGRIHPSYTRQDIFRFYPRTPRRAIVFHSIEAGVLEISEVRESIGSCDLVIARTKSSAENARRAGARRVVEATDIAWSLPFVHAPAQKGLAVALRVSPARDEESLNELRRIIAWLADSGPDIDFVRVEPPIHAGMLAQGYGTERFPRARIFGDDAMYQPFETIRDAVISCRLHTTILALIHGNQRILQFHVEPGTNKIRDMLCDIGLESLPVHPVTKLSLESIQEFLGNPARLPEQEIHSALQRARAMVGTGLDALEEWLQTV